MSTQGKVKTYNCTECGKPYAGKARLHWPISPSRNATVCVECIDRLVAKSKAPGSVREFIAWYQGNKVAVPLSTVVRSQAEEIAQLRRLVEQQAKDLANVRSER